ncbi:MAG: tetratricopeptide repeat protein [Solirubrobacteraceae bacterium]
MQVRVLDIATQMLLLELEPPFGKRDVQLARRRMAKRWHPDIAPPGKQLEHERHLKAINEAADELERIAETSRGGRVTRNAVRASSAAARRAREEAGARAYEAEQRARAEAKDRAQHDPFGSRVPDHSVVHRYARCTSYPEWGVGTVAGIYFTGDGGDSAGGQWARVRFSHGIRTVPAGSLRFVDFSKPDPAEERVERFMTAAQHAIAEGDYPLAARRLVYARDAQPRNVAVLRLMTLAFWQAGELEAAARSARDWARIDGERPAAHRFLARIYEDIGAIDLAQEAAQRAVQRGPADASGWERLGRLRLRLMDVGGALQALERALALGPTVEGLLDLALARSLSGDLGGELSACEQATLLEPDSVEAWSRYAHALARSDRLGDCVAACERALELGAGQEVQELLARAIDAEPRALPA